MWHRLKKQLATERLQLNRLLETHHAILAKCRTAEPTVDEVPALASILHSFYTGIENAFKRIAVEMDGGVPSGEFWHSELLERMSSRASQRPAVISESLRLALERYLDFRHVFRHAYSFELKWSRMAPLVLELETNLNRFEEELDRFLRAMEFREG